MSAMSSGALYNSKICRICAQDNPSGISIFTVSPGEIEIYHLINQYLPIKVCNDGIYPKTICPSCHIYLQATKSFFDILAEGQNELAGYLQQYSPETSQEKVASSPETPVAASSNPEVGSDAVVVKRGRGRPRNSDRSPVKMADISGDRFPETRTLPIRLGTNLDDVYEKELGLDVTKEIEEVGSDAVLVKRGKGQPRNYGRPPIMNPDISEERFPRTQRLPVRLGTSLQGKDLDGVYEDELGLEVTKETEEPEVIGKLESKRGMVQCSSAHHQISPHHLKCRCDNCTKGLDENEYMAELKKIEFLNGGDIANDDENMETFTAQKVSQEKAASISETPVAASSSNPEVGGDAVVMKRGRGRPRNSDRPPVKMADISERPRTRRLPLRFGTSLQGKDLDKVYEDFGLEGTKEIGEPEVIGKLESKRGERLGEVMVQCSSSHEQISRQHLKYRCENCTKVFINEPWFLKHTSRCQGNRIISEITETPAPSNSISEPLKCARVRYKPDQETGKIACGYCPKKYKSSSSLSYHKVTKHNSRRYVCYKCNRSFQHKDLLRKHQVAHSTVRSFKCDYCPMTFKTKSNLRSHITTHTRSNKYFCELCGQIFFHKTSLNLHTRIHTNPKSFECNICLKKFNQRGNLLEHVRTHTGEKPFKCEECDRHFTTSSQRRLHMKRHTGERPWTCNFCQKSFLHKSTYNNHVLRHKGEKPYSCNYCGRMFTELWGMKKHKRIHTGEKPYRCSVCGKAFSDSSNLNKHKEKKCSNIDISKNLKDLKNDYQVNGAQFISTEDTSLGQEQIIYVSYTDPQDPNIKVSETIVVEKETEDQLAAMMEVMDEMGNPLKFAVQDGGTQLQVSETIVVEKETEDPLAAMMEVMDEVGNPLKFTMQDGTQLQVMTRDGRSLEVRTPEGQIIQVKLTTDSGEPVSPQLTPIIISSSDPSTISHPPQTDALGGITSIDLVSSEGDEHTLTLTTNFLQLT